MNYETETTYSYWFWFKVGGPYWDVPVGRKDSKTASYEFATSNIPTPEEGLISIISKFHNQGLSVEDMVALSGINQSSTPS